MKKYLISVFSAFLLFTNIYSLTLQEIRDDIRIKIGDSKTDTNNRSWSDTTLNARINMVQDVIARETLCIQARISTPTVTNQREYDYNADVIAPFRLSYYIDDSDPPAYERLEWYTIAALDKEDNGEWEDLTPGLPTKYYERGHKYGLSIRPSSVYASTYAVQIDYYKKPDTLTVDTTAPFDADIMLYPYHELIIKGVVIMCLEDERGSNVNDLKTEYWALINKMSAELKSKRDKGIWK